MYTKAISAAAPTDDKAFIELLLTAHATRLRQTREYLSAHRPTLLEIVRAFVRERCAEAQLTNNPKTSD